MEPVLGRLVGPTFDPSFKVLTRHCQAIIEVLSSYHFFINLGLDLGRYMKEELDISLVKC